jgi:hypothetical protein
MRIPESGIGDFDGFRSQAGKLPLIFYPQTWKNAAKLY